MDSIPIEPSIKEIIRASGIERLYPPQAQAMGPVLEGKSVVLACPTASGKSLVAYIAVVVGALRKRRGLYIVPLRSMASEKYADLKDFEKLGIKVGITMGEWDISARELESVDILVATSEKADSLLRHKSRWMDEVGVVVADEAHLIREPSRGPTLEVTLTRLKRHEPRPQIVALSATIANSPSVAEWLDAVHTRSDFRPVPLKYGIYHSSQVTFADGSKKEIPAPGDPVERLVRASITDGGQALVFVNTRKSSETLAEKLGLLVRPMLSKNDANGLEDLSKRLMRTGEEATTTARRLSSMVLSGVAYHNAALTNAERALVERAFKQGMLKCLTATPTLAAGVNLPARMVVVRDLTRYEDSIGSNAPLPVFEVHQMCGRAGRPRYDPYGEAILISREGSDPMDLMDRYLNAPPEEVDSKLAASSVLRTHLLALVASDEVRSEKELEEFLKSTFFGHDYEVQAIRAHLSEAKEFLVQKGLLMKGELKATPFGKLVSDLYLDPVTAVLMRQALIRSGPKTTIFSYLAAVASTPDVIPMYIRRDEYPDVVKKWRDEAEHLLITGDEELLGMDEESFLSTIKTAMVIEKWIDDRIRITDITDGFGVGAGDLHNRAERMSWLISAMAQMAKWERRALTGPLDELSIRVTYGIRSDLIDLVSLRGVGRVRGRLLYQHGFKSREELSRASEEQIVHCLGSAGSTGVAKDIVAQLGVHRGGRAADRREVQAAWIQRDLLGEF